MISIDSSNMAVAVNGVSMVTKNIFDYNLKSVEEKEKLAKNLIQTIKIDILRVVKNVCWNYPTD